MDKTTILYKALSSLTQTISASDETSQLTKELFYRNKIK